MPLQSFDRVGCLRIGSSRCSFAAFLALIARIPAAKQTHARVRASHLSLKSHLLSEDIAELANVLAWDAVGAQIEPYLDQHA